MIVGNEVVVLRAARKYHKKTPAHCTEVLCWTIPSVAIRRVVKLSLKQQPIVQLAQQLK